MQKCIVQNVCFENTTIGKEKGDPKIVLNVCKNISNIKEITLKNNKAIWNDKYSFSFSIPDT